MQIRRVPFAVLIAILLATATLGAPGVSRAGDGAKDAKKKPHLRYQKTYEAALTEARIRNLPVFISRHKDF